MKSIDRINDDISDILPDSSDLLGTDGLEQRASMVQDKSKSIHDRKTAQELAKAKYRLARAAEGQAARQAVKAFRKKKQEAQEAVYQQLEDEDKHMPAKEVIDLANRVAVSNGQPAMAENVAKQIMLSQGTTRPEVVKLLSSLNINLDLQLSKTDTANLLACLLTANEKQLQAIYDNDKTPLAIKIVVKRLMNDSRIGEIQTVEKLWDRIFGKTGMMLDLPQESKAAGIIPNTPVSREAYILIRESLLK